MNATTDTMLHWLPENVRRKIQTRLGTEPAALEQRNGLRLEQRLTEEGERAAESYLG